MKRVNRMCDVRGYDKKKCTGLIVEATREGDWARCDLCQGIGYRGSERCPPCNGTGWTLTRSRWG